MLVVIRLMGKRTVGNFTAFDLLVALMLGEIVDEIIYPDREHNMEADQMQPRTGNQRGQALHEF
jgi:uncharacterized membrane protein YcaP (DUF421 family)